MSKFSEQKRGPVAEGYSARKRGVEFTSLEGVLCTCDLGMLTGADDESILETATARTKNKNGEPKHGDPIFDFECAIERVARACLDPESPDSAPARFFASADEVRANLDRERINYLATLQDALQDSVSPRKKSLSEPEFLAITLQLANQEAEAASPLDVWPRSLLLAYARTLAERLVIVAMSKSSSIKGSSVEDSMSAKTLGESSSDLVASETVQ